MERNARVTDHGYKPDMDADGAIVCFHPTAPSPRPGNPPHICGRSAEDHERWDEGFYRDRTNDDLWIMAIVAGQETWRWINGNRWRFVPRENLIKAKWAGQ